MARGGMAKGGGERGGRERHGRARHGRARDGVARAVRDGCIVGLIVRYDDIRQIPACIIEL